MTRRRADLVRKRARQGWSRERISKTYKVARIQITNILSGVAWSWDPRHKCVVCNKSFYADQPTQRHCGPLCRLAEERQKGRDSYHRISKAASEYTIRAACRNDKPVRKRHLPKDAALRRRLGGTERGLFSDAEVMEIRDRYADGVSIAALAEEFDVCVATIHAIAKGKVYKHLPTVPDRMVPIVCAYCGKTFKSKRRRGSFPLFCPGPGKVSRCAAKAHRLRLRKGSLDVAYEQMQMDAANFLVGNKPVKPTKKKRVRRGRVAPRCANCNRFYVRTERSRKYVKYCTDECIEAGHAKTYAYRCAEQTKKNRKARRAEQVGTVCKQCGKSPLPLQRWAYCSTKCSEKFTKEYLEERHRQQKLARGPKIHWFDDDDLIGEVRKRFGAGETQDVIAEAVGLNRRCVPQAVRGDVRADLPLVHRQCQICKVALPFRGGVRYCGKKSCRDAAARARDEPHRKCVPLAEIASLIRGLKPQEVAKATGVNQCTVIDLLHDLDKPGRTVRRPIAEQIQKAAAALKAAQDQTPEYLEERLADRMARSLRRTATKEERVTRAECLPVVALVEESEADMKKRRAKFMQVFAKVAISCWDDLPPLVEVRTLKSLCENCSVSELARGAWISSPTAEKIIKQRPGRVRDTVYLRVLAFAKVNQNPNLSKYLGDADAAG